jgi:hypothetical protein
MIADGSVLYIPCQATVVRTVVHKSMVGLISNTLLARTSKLYEQIGNTHFKTLDMAN